MFKISKSATDWFGEGAGKEGLTSARIMDYYYLSALVGLLTSLKENNKQLKEIKDIPETRDFMDEWPGEYRAKKYNIIGLFVETELQRLVIDREDKDRVKEFFKKILSAEDSNAHLTQYGGDKLSSYSYLGFLIICDEMKKMPQTYELFLDKYFKILSKFI